VFALLNDADYYFHHCLYEFSSVTNNNNKNTLAAVDLANLRALQPGAVVDLQISTPTSPKRVKTQYVGLDYPRCMIFQFPSLSKFGVLKDIIYPKNTVIVRYVLEGKSGQVIAFKVKVSQVLSQPSPLVITTFPTSLQSLGLRSEKRASPGIAAELTFSDNTSNHKALIVDVSHSGCRLGIEEQLLGSVDGEPTALDSEVTVCVDLSDKTILLEGRIKNVKSEEGYVFLGIQFQSAHRDIDVLLKRHIINL
jgi:c-di-GMP-binding flagellar brake protein YcgR